MFLSVGDGRSQIPSSGTSQGPAINVFSFGGSRCRTCRQHLLGAHHRRLQLQWWPLPDLPPAHPRWSAIIVFNFGGGRCRICRQDPPQEPTSTSSTLVMATAGHTARPPPPMGPASTSSTSVVAAAGHATSPPRGSAIDVFSFGGGRCRTCHQHTQGARHQRLQLRWWPLPNMAPAPLGGPPSTSSTLVVAAVGSAASTPQEGRHQRLQLRWWLLSDLPIAPPGAPVIDVS
jgi:hypothetical protein